MDNIGLQEHFFDIMIDQIADISSLQHLSMEGNYIGNVLTVPQCSPLMFALPYGIKTVSFAVNNFPSEEKNGFLWQIGRPPFDIEGFNISYQFDWRDDYFMDNSYSYCRESPCEITIPSGMKWLDLSHNGFEISRLPEIIFINNNSFESFYARNTHLQLFNNRIYCHENIVPNINHVDISDNEIICFNETIFENCDWSSLKYLNIKGNRLGHSQLDVCNDDPARFLKFLKPLNNLKTLDISNNVINVNPVSNSFKGLSNLHYLHMSNMGLRKITIDFSYLHSLEFVDLSGNSLTTLSEAFIREVESLWTEQPNDTLTIEMSHNLLQCNCESVFYLKWLNGNNRIVKVPNYESFYCMNATGQWQSFMDLNNIIAHLESTCMTTPWDIPKRLCSCMAAIYFVITISTFSYRLRFYLRYQLLILKLKRLHLENLLDDRKWVYHAFISCERQGQKGNFFQTLKMMRQE